MLVFFLLPLANATIMLSQPKAIYSYGDDFSVSATLKTTGNAEGFFILTILCENESKEIKREYLALAGGEEKKFDEKIKLSSQLISGMEGECNLEAEYANEKTTSQKFVISKNIDVSLSLNKFNYNVGENVNVNGEARKTNSEKVSGFVDIFLENSDVKITKAIKDGNFNVNFSIPGNIKAGDYSVVAKVYDENENEGSSKLTINIKSKPNKIEIATNKQNVKPGENITFQVFIYDQANDAINGDVSVVVKDSEDNEIIKKLVKTSDYEEINLEKNSTSGYWKIEASVGDITTKRLFYVEELEEVKFEIIEDILTITNLGNIVYSKSVQITIDDEIEIKDLYLGVGESKKFRLIAPDGNHKISITDGSRTLNQADVFLTGKIIGVMDIRSGNIFYKYPIVWLFLIVVFALFILMLMERVTKKKFFAYPIRRTETKKIFTKETGEKVFSGQEKTSENITEAEHSIVMHGRKENASIVTIKIKNPQVKAEETLNKIGGIISGKKGAVYKTQNFIIGIFSSATTKTFSNEMIAIKTSEEINILLNEHNRKFKARIDYGIGLNSGEIIVKKDKKLEFTSIGNTLSLAKKISEVAKEEILLSENIQKNVMGEVKTEKGVKDGINIYNIKGISERDRYSGFIHGFLERQK